MSTKNTTRHYFAFIVLILSTIAITALGITIIANNPNKAIDIFNAIFPVLASWVGTVLAFYFGRENFESANQQVKELVDKISPEQMAQKPVSSIMRPLSKTQYLAIPQEGGESSILLSSIQSKFNDRVSRIPILSSELTPKYMIHESRINSYLANAGSTDHSLETFLKTMATQKINFGRNHGFIVVSEATTIAQAKSRLEAVPSSQDIFITQTGSDDEAVLGWISNTRLSKQLKG